MDAVAPTSASAGGLAIKKKTPTAKLTAQDGPRRARRAGAFTIAPRISHARAGIDIAILGDERRADGRSALTDQREQAADMSRRKGTAVDQEPSSPRLRGGH